MLSFAARLNSLTLVVTCSAILGCGSAAGDGAGGGDQAATVKPSQYKSCQTYAKLSQTGLYEMKGGTRTDTIASGVLAFHPAYPLWSDGLEKTRWIRLPPGAKVDTSDMDHWRFPPGTILWKEFRAPSENGNLGRRIETRAIEIGCGSGEAEFFVGSFIWDSKGEDADLALAGGTAAITSPRPFTHTIPKQDACFSCHSGEGKKGASGVSDATLVLGFSAIQLGEPDQAVSTQTLRDRGLLSHPPEGDGTFVLPGTATEKAALGYLHGNCGHCHNPEGIADGMTDQRLRFQVSDTRLSSMQATSVFTSIVGVATQIFDSPLRVDPKDFEKSAIIVRMSSREASVQMPPLGTAIVDDGGLARLRAWGATLAAGP